MTLQTTHNTTTTSLQRELDTLRQEHQRIKIQLRELEMGNDDLERNERAISSSLADVEQKYARALEEKILLEHELLDKANVEEWVLDSIVVHRSHPSVPSESVCRLKDSGHNVDRLCTDQRTENESPSVELKGEASRPEQLRLNNPRQPE